jgi:DNA-binding HxlR family transcriptional regulator
MVSPIFSKFIRPEETDKGRISDRDLDILEAVLRYRFSPTSELVRLVGGNQDVTQRRLRKLWEWGLINRFAFPGIRTHSEFHYYLDNRKALEVLVEHARLADIHAAMLEELRANREKNYADAAFRGQHMQLGFLKHSLQITRMHFLLEMAARTSGGRINLGAWRQGAELRGHKVEVPEMKARRQDGNTFLWEEQQGTQRLPVEPDALFSLELGNQQAHFCTRLIAAL